MRNIDNKKSFLNTLMAFILTFIMIFSEVTPALAEAINISGSVYKISTTDEFEEFAKKCSLDTWSKGKTFMLENDIDLTGSSFTSIPTFAGTFDGNGHNIVGFELSESGSQQGLFRYIQNGAVVKNLMVIGSVIPGGSKNVVGGIVGDNSGSVIDCTFAGVVSGETTVGGIAGINNEDGTVSGCEARGSVKGKKNTGGIIGKNLGTVAKSTSSCSINTTSEDIKSSLANIDLDVDLSTIISNVNESDSSDESDFALSSHTDTGGIVGYSSGIIQDCVNSGIIGYQHMGYNVGGIVGRQSGYISGCTNEGKVYGRKDVGGIAGQTEPYILVTLSEDSLTRLQNELDKMQSMINDMLDRAESTSDDVSNRLTAISDYTDSARESTKVIFDEGTDFVDDNIDEINDIGTTLSDSLDKMVDILNDVEASSDALTKAISQLKKSVSKLSDAADSAKGTSKDAEKAFDDLEDANNAIKDAVGTVRDALDELSKALVADGDNEEAIRDAVDKLTNSTNGALTELGKAIGNADMAISQIINLIKSGTIFPDDETKQEILNTLTNLSTALKDMNGYIADAANSLGFIVKNTHIDWATVKDAFKSLSGVIGSIKDAASSVSAAIKHLKDVMDGLKDMSGDLGSAFDKMADSLGTMSKASGYLTDAVGGLRDLTEDLANEDPIHFRDLGEDFRDAGNNLNSTLASISDELDELNESINSSTKDILNDVKAINNQFNVIMDIMIDAILDITDNSGDGVSDYIQDTSDENINATKLGKIKDCVNNGIIEADKNVGGIAGTMGIEFDLDPEDDLSDSNIFKNSYETKSILESCTNNAKITGKKDCIGGISGRMDLGTVLYCENYGDVESIDGDYVGGVIGRTESPVRFNYAKCIISGLNYVGGITGSGTEIKNCAAIVTIDNSDECKGAISGYADMSDSEIENNYFVSDEIAGIDGISYSGKAEPVDYDTLCGIDGIPDQFLSFNITFKAGEKIVEVIPVRYGERLYSAELPEVPEKDGCYGEWPAEATEKVTDSFTAEAEYADWVTVVASNRTQDDGKKALALAEGEFTDKAVLDVTDSDIEPPKEAKFKDNVNVWNISLIGTDLTSYDVVPIRLLNIGGGKAKVWKLDGMEWKEADFTVNGHYLKLKMDGTNATYCIAASSTGISKESMIGGCLLLAALAVFVIKRIKKKNKKNGNTKSKADKSLKKMKIREKTKNIKAKVGEKKSHIFNKDKKED